MKVEITSVLIVLAATTNGAPIDNAAVVAALNADINDHAVYSLDGPFASMCDNPFTPSPP